MTTSIFANYGVLGHEKEVVYTTAPIEGAVSDKIIVDIPLECSQNTYGEILIKWMDVWYLLNDVLDSDRDAAPCIMVPRKKYIMRCKLTVVEEHNE